MKFVLLIYQGYSPLPGTKEWNALSNEEQKAIYADYAEFNKTAGLVSGLPLGLPNVAKTVQVRNGKPEVKTGTYMPEGVGGYCILEADNIEAAVAVASRIPAARLGGAIEIRPAEQYW
ncbi:YciI family protein [Bdellovibrio sp. HCB117]|uniref:YciI family protein n=1 Tax=Bdellovibrio sp. HCB117 TaxID=3394359 RepID=UPI0039B57650